MTPVELSTLRSVLSLFRSSTLVSAVGTTVHPAPDSSIPSVHGAAAVEGVLGDVRYAGLMGTSGTSLIDMSSAISEISALAIGAGS